jgi:hypothetical protein
MVLVVISDLDHQHITLESTSNWTDIEAEYIEPSVVRCGLLSEGIIGVSANWAVHEVVFGDKVCGTRVQASGEEGRHDEVD